MLSSLKKVVFCCACATTTVITTGCGDVTIFPDTQAAAASTNQVSVGTIQGSNYGGHAPIVGSHIYLLQPGATGYGSLTKGLLNASYAGSYPTTLNSNDQFVPSLDSAGKPYYYETTDSLGAFNLTGDYTCTVGQPVFIVGYGGNPSYQGAGPNVFTVATEEDYNDGSGYWLTYTTTTPQLFYTGESVTVTGNTIGAGFNAVGTVLGTGKHYDGTSAPLTTTSFSFYFPYSAYPNGGLNIGNTTTPSFSPSDPGGATITATGTPTFNPAAVNIAMLGLCPSSGNFSTGASALKYVYMNEISTTAFAYAMNQYANWSATDQTGNDEFHIGAPNTVQAQVGIQNAAINAGNLYDIQGGSGVSTVYAGEGHLARATTPGGNGTVPQSTLDTLGNILAACVDSQNTYRSGSGTISTQCLTLDQYAQDNGVYDTTASTHYAFNIAQVALNIAHYPQGAGTGTTSSGVQTVTPGTATTARAFTTALFNLPTGNVPFTPNLAAAPNDFAVAIQWVTGAASSDVEIDASGNAWASAAGGTLTEITPSGTLTAYTGTLSTASTLGVAIDGVNGNIWVPATTGVYKYTAGTAAGTLVGTGNTTAAAGIVLDSSLNQYLTNLGDTGGLSSLTKQSATGVAAGGNFPVATGYVANSAGACANAIGWVALDTSNYLWTATSNNTYNAAPYVCRFDSLGNLQYSLAVPTGLATQAGGLGGGGGFGFPHGLATDAGNNAWFSEKNADRLYKITAGTTTANAGYTYLQLPGVLSAPRGVAVDGANTIWVASTGDLNANTGAKYATGLAQFSNADTVITPSYITGAAYTTTPTTSLGNAAIDPSGDVWAVQSQAQGSATAPTMVYEYIGLAAPTVTPIAAAKAASKVGVKP